MKLPSQNLKNFAAAFLQLSEDALNFSRNYVETSAKEPKNPDLELFFARALVVVQEFQQQLEKSKFAASAGGKPKASARKTPEKSAKKRKPRRK